MKRILFPLFFIIAIAVVFLGNPSIQAAGLGGACESDSQCTTGDCATRQSTTGGVCMPLSITSDAEIHIYHIDNYGFVTNGYVGYSSSNGQNLFDNAIPGANWQAYGGAWSSVFCNQTVYHYEDSVKHYWKATNGTQYWYAYRLSSDGTDTPAINALADIICKTATVQKKSDGSYCSSASECLGGYCVHGYCRSSSYYCGDNYCDGGESCSSCSSDCGACKKSDGSSCGYWSECSGGWCVHDYCRSSAVYCGDGYCDDGEGCSTCYSDCGPCMPVAKANGESCNTASECLGGYCVHDRCRSSSTSCGDGYCDIGELEDKCYADCSGYLKSDGSSCNYDSECSSNYCLHNKCRSSSVYCGDTYCDSGEFCSSCPYDCGSCPVEISNLADGEVCDKNDQCSSGNCQNYRCCLKGKTCCLSTSNCPSKYYCSEERSYCLPGLPVGQSCTKDEQCESNNCKNSTCCEWGQTCCKNHSDCDRNDYCQQGTHYCRDKWSLGSDCGDYGSDMCLSGYCNPETWKCAEKPAGAGESISSVPTAVPQEEAITISADDLSLKECEEGELSVRITNRSQKEITLDDRLLIENLIPYNIDIQKSTLQIFKTKLLPGETINTKGQAGQREMIEGTTFNTCKRGAGSSGSGVIKLRVVYFVDNRAKWAEDELKVSVGATHIQKEETASHVFNETMLWEGKEVDYTDNGKEYIFVSVENKSLQQAAINEWQVAHGKMEKAASNLKGHFTGTITPEIVSFFETVKNLEEAKSYQEITETSIRAIAPPAIVAGFDFANLLDAVDKQKNVERGLLTHFDATDFVNIPIYDEKGDITSYTKAIVKEQDGKFYAVKVGNL